MKTHSSTEELKCGKCSVKYWRKNSYNNYITKCCGADESNLVLDSGNSKLEEVASMWMIEEYFKDDNEDDEELCLL